MAKNEHMFSNRGWQSPNNLAFNPLKKIPRNMACPCESGKKFKRCHLNLIPSVVQREVAHDYEAAMHAGVHLIRFTNDPDAPMIERKP